VQSTQAIIDWPHAAAAVPGWHMPFEQHAPLHGCDTLQAVVHALAVVSHEEPAGQSETEAQPQRPPLAPWTQTEPMLVPVQSRHAPPDEPHAGLTRPDAQTPA
jgi:hypothetical protein